jgi:hypothetical protein
MMMAQPGQPGGELSQLASNIGRSGIATLQARRDREKIAREAEMGVIMQKYYKALAEKQALPPEEERLVRMYATDPEFAKAYKAFQEAKYDPRAAAALEQLRLKGQLGMGVNPFTMMLGGGQGGMYDLNPGGYSGAGFRVLGSRD